MGKQSKPTPNDDRSRALNPEDVVFTASEINRLRQIGKTPPPPPPSKGKK